MNEKLVTVARFDNYIEAELAKQRLADEEITAFVMGQNVGNVYGGVPAVLDIELQTPQSQAARAKQLLDTWSKQAAQEAEADDVEPHDDGSEETGENTGEQE